MSTTGLHLARVRRGPLRTIAARLPDGVEVLDCGHLTDAGRVDRNWSRLTRRCPLCPYTCGEHRAAYQRDYQRARYQAGHSVAP